MPNMTLGLEIQPCSDVGAPYLVTEQHAAMVTKKSWASRSTTSMVTVSSPKHPWIMVKKTTWSGGHVKATLRSPAVGVLLQIMAILVWDVCGAYGQSGFISIDCGANSSYEDDSGISWAADRDYISAGKSVSVDTSTALFGTEGSQIARRMSTARVFPEPNRTKFCYVIPEVVKNSMYLIRYRFLAGNLTSTSSPNITFKITANQYVYGSVSFSPADSYTPQTVEFTFVTAGNKSLSLCLAPETGIPFISTLELRLLPPLFYQSIRFPELAMNLIQRWDCGASQTAAPVRYPSDIYDRLYYTPPATYNYTSVANSEFNSSGLDDILISTPLAVLQSAWVAPRGGTINITLPARPAMFFFLYFAELERLGSGAKRELLGFVNNESLGDAMTVRTSGPSLLFNIYAPGPLNTVNVSLRASNTSTEGPILNAFEAFEVTYFNNSYETFASDVEAISVFQASLNLSSWTGDPCVPYSWEWLQCSNLNGAVIWRIVEINLPNYNLSGSLPMKISELGALKVMHLQNNHISGPIPTSLASLSDLHTLNLDNNQLTGNVPEVLLLKNESKALNFSAAGNPGLCDGTNTSCTNVTSPAPSPFSLGKKKSSNVGIIAGAIGGVVAVVALGLVLLFRYRNKLFRSSQKDDSRGAKDQSHGRRFTYDEVKAATNNFQKKIGQGGFGEVFHGKLSGGEEIAVKKNIARDGQGTSEFRNEVGLLSRVHHRNLVPLIGYCDEAGREILIYAFMSEGTLREHLDAEERQPLGWSRRLDIALNSARGLEYLHNSCCPPIIHRDVKSSNILLTRDLLAKVADFGISKTTTDRDKTRGITTDVKGTIGYLDPEYFEAGRLTTKSDVYCFGAVLLELITGKRPSDMIRSSETEALQVLHNWVRSAVHAGDIQPVMDPYLLQQQQGACNMESVWKVVELALQSLDREGYRRPEMQEIVQGLAQAIDLQKGSTQTQTLPRMETGHSPSHLSPANFDSYQRVDSSSRTRNGGLSSSRDSTATRSWATNITAR